MNKDLLIDGREYISASRASKKVGYAQDYVGELVRTGRIPGRMIGRTWYVDINALLDHKKNGSPRVAVEPKNSPSKGLSAVELMPNVGVVAIGGKESLLPKLDKPIEGSFHTDFLSRAVVVVVSVLIIGYSGMNWIEYLSPSMLEGLDISIADASTASALGSVLDFISGQKSNSLNSAVLLAEDHNANTDSLNSILAGAKILPKANGTLANNFGSGISDDIKAYIRGEVARIAATRDTYVSYVNSASAPIDLEAFRRSILAEVGYHSTGQSSSDVGSFSGALAYLQSNGQFANSNVSNLSFTNANGTNALFANATSTNLFGTSGSFTNLLATNETSTSLLTTNATSTNLFASTANLGALIITNATSTNFFSTTASSTNLFATAANLGTLALNNGTSTNFFSTNLFSVTASTTNLFSTRLAIGTSSPDASALVDLYSTTKGFLAPRMTDLQRDAISSPTSGLLIYNTVSNAYNYYNGSTWTAVGVGSGATQWVTSGSNIYYSIGNIGVGTVQPFSARIESFSSLATALPASLGATQSSSTMRLTNGSVALDFGAYNTSPSVWIQASNPGSLGTSYPILLNPNSGSTGLVGIGTTNPTEKLDIQGTATTNIKVKSTGAFSAGLTLIPNNLSTGFVISATASATPDLTFTTASGTEAMRIKSNGNIGIGTTNPQQLLSLNAPTGSAGTPIEFDVASTPKAYIGVAGATSSLIIGSALNDLILRTQGGKILLSTNSGASSSVDIDSSGNVGIGTAAPANKLQIGASDTSGLAAGMKSKDLAILRSGANAFPAGFLFDTGTTDTNRILKITSESAPSFSIQTYAGSTGGVAADAPLTLQPLGGFVGIGTTTPGALLTVGAGGSGATESDIVIDSGSAAGGSSLLLFHRQSVLKGLIGIAGANGSIISGSTANDLAIRNNGPIRFSVNNGTSGAAAIDGSGIFSVAGLAGTGNRCLKADSAGNIVAGSTDCSTGGSGADNLGNHIATQNVQLNNFWLSNDGGSEGIRVDNSGNVGIGTGSPDAKFTILAADNQNVLTINGNGGNARLAIGIDSSANSYIRSKNALDLRLGVDSSDYVTIKSTGNVGIGTTTPQQPLSVAANAGASALQLIGRSADNIATLNFSTNSGAASAFIQGNGSWIRSQADGGVHFRNGGTPSVASTDFTIEGMNLGIGTTTPAALLNIASPSATGQIRLTSSVAPENYWEIARDNVTTGGFQISGTNISGILTPRFSIIANSGNVGIGTTTPDSLLSINSGGTATPDLRIRRTAAGGNVTGLRLTSNGNGTINYRAAQIQLTVPAGNTTDASLDFVVGNASTETAATTAMSILTNGNIGIGTTTPQTKLEVMEGAQNNNIMSLGTASGILSLRPFGANYGLFAGVRFTTGDAWLQVGRTDGIATAFNLLLQPSGGNVGIGTTTPSAKLHITGIAGTGDIFAISSSTNSRLFTVASTGFVGIGTTSPASLLYVGAGTTGTNAAAFTLDSGSGAGAQPLIGFSRNSTNKAIIGVAGGTDFITGGAAADDLVIRSNQRILLHANGAAGTAQMVIQNSGNVGIGTTSPELYRTGANNLVVYGAGDAGLSIISGASNLAMIAFGRGLSTADGTASNRGKIWYDQTNEAFRIQPAAGLVTGSSGLTVSSAGFLGIGTTSPQALLNVYAPVGTTTTELIRLDNPQGGATLSNRIAFYQGNSENGRIDSRFDGTVGWSLAFATRNIGTTATEKMIITNAGLVGIGTTTPGQALSVAGSIMASSFTSAGNKCIHADSTGTLSLATTDCATGGSGADNLGNSIATQNIQLNNFWLSNAGSNNGIRIDNNGYISSGTSTAASGDEGQVGTNAGSRYWMNLQGASGFAALSLQNGGSISDGTTLGVVQFTGSGETSGQRIKAQILGMADGSTSGARGGAITFNTKSDSTGAITERMRVTSTGNVGIGTTTPSSLLTLRSATSNSTVLSLYDSGAIHQMVIRAGESGLANPAIGMLSGQGFDIITNNIARISISNSNNNGNVGIGTSTPGAQLDVYGTAGNDSIQISGGGAQGTRLRLNSTGAGGRAYHIVSTANSSGFGGGKFVITDNTASDAARFTIDSSGLVGIGTTTPAFPLDVNTGATRSVVQLRTTNTQGPVIQLFADVAPIADRVIGAINFASPLGGANSQILTAFSDSGGVNSYMRFTTTGAERLRIDAAGNVGIGSTTPQAKLVVSNGTSGASFPTSNGIVVAESTGSAFFDTLTPNANSGGLRFNFPALSSAGFVAYDGPSSTPANVLRLGTNGSTRVSIDSSGNVGIGVTNPGSKLEVKGTIARVVSDGDVTSASVGLMLQNVTGTAANVATPSVFFDTGNGGGQSQIYARKNPSDTNAGGNLVFETGNSGGTLLERLRINSSGNVGIGITNPSAKLEVNGTIKITAGSGGGLTFADGTTITSNAAAGAGITSATDLSLAADNDSNGSGVMTFATHGAERMRIDNAGFVGIGTTAPGSPLEVIDSSTGASVRIRNTSASGFGAIDIFDSTGAKVSSFVHSNSAASLLPSSTWFGSRNAESLHFVTNGSTPRMTIDATGNVGIGTTTPGAELDIVKATAGAGSDQLRVINSAAAALNNYAEISFLTGTSPLYMARIRAASDNAGATSTSLRFFTTNAGAEGEKMRIDNAGNVGIGTTTPQTNLHIYGTAGSGNFVIARVQNTAPDGASYFNMVGDSGLSTGMFRAGSTYTNFGGPNSLNIYQGNNAPIAFTTNNAATPQMVITGAGNVGIGTTAPLARLDLGTQAPGTDTALTYSMAAAGNSNWVLSQGSIYDATSVDQYQIFNGQLSGGTKANPTFTGSPTGGYFIRNSTGAAFANSRLDLGYFSGTGAGTTGTTTLSIVGNNVGIGTTAPNRTLQLSSTGSTGITLTGTGSGGQSFGLISTSGGSSLGDGKFSIFQDGIGSRLAIDGSTGNVGIGTTNPAVLFEASTSAQEVARFTSSNASGGYIGVGGGIIGSQLAVTGGSGSASNLGFRSGGDVSISAGGGTITTIFKSTGNVGIGQTNPGAKLEIDSASGATSTKIFDTNGSAGVINLQSIVSSTAARTHLSFSNDSSGAAAVGSITTTGSATAFNTSSDIRLKNDLGRADTTEVLKDVVIHNFTWKLDGTLDRGVFAQEAYLVKPSAIAVGTDDLGANGLPVHPWAVDYSKFVPDLIVGWQVHDGRLEKLESNASSTNASLFALGNRITNTETRLDALEHLMASTTAFTISTSTPGFLASVIDAVQNTVFSHFRAGEIRTDNLCVGDVCVTRDQFLEMTSSSGTTFSGVSQGSSAPASPAPTSGTASSTPDTTSTSTPPTTNPSSGITDASASSTPVVSAPAPTSTDTSSSTPTTDTTVATAPVTDTTVAVTPDTTTTP
jgi:hypothetical protein